MDLSIIELQYVVSVAETGSFTKTAELFYTTQSTVSKRIAMIESRLNVALLKRSGGRVTLTPAGELFVDHARRIVDEYDILNSSISRYLQRSGRKISVGMHCLASHYNTIQAIHTFEEKNPEVEMRLFYLSNWDVYDSLASGSCNIGILYDERLDETKFTAIPLLRDHLVLAVSSTHPLAKRKSISLKELKDEPMIITSNRTQLQAIMKRACKEAGFEPNIKEMLSFPEPLLSYLKLQNCCTLILEGALQYYALEGITLIPLEENIETHLSIIVPNNGRLSDSEKKLIACLKEHVAKPTAGK